MQLNLNGPLTTQTGYGIVVTNFFLNLIKQGVDVTLWPILNQYDCLPENNSAVQQSLKNQEHFSVEAPCFRIYHQFSMAESIGRGRRIGMPIFELDTFTSREKTHLSSLDKIIVNSSWAKKVVEDNGINVPTSIVPLGYDPTIFYPTTPSKRTSVVFLNIGKWSMNKGHDVLKTIFERAFSPADDVELWMCCHNHFLRPHEQKEWEDYYKNGPMGHKIKIIPWQSSQRDLADLMRQADVGVFPARGEGWNLEALEMMACGKEVIGTNYSGQADFVKQFAIDIDGLEAAQDGKWFFGQGNWAKLGDDFINSFAGSMQRRYQEITKLFGKENCKRSIEQAANFTWEKSTCNLITEIFD